MGGIGTNLLLVIAFVIVAWAVLEVLGFEMALLSSIVLSVVLTLLLNLLLGGFGRRSPSS